MFTILSDEMRLQIVSTPTIDQIDMDDTLVWASEANGTYTAKAGYKCEDWIAKNGAFGTEPLVFWEDPPLVSEVFLWLMYWGWGTVGRRCLFSISDAPKKKKQKNKKSSF